MRAVMRALKVVHYDDINNKIAEFRAAQKIHRDELKDKMIKTLASMTAGSVNQQTIVETIQNLQRELDASTNLENALLDFVNQLK